MAQTEEKQEKSLLETISSIGALESELLENEEVKSETEEVVEETQSETVEEASTFKVWGEDDDKKFILFHYSILSEGINVRGLTHSVLLRNLPIIEMAQTIGRVIRLHKYDYQDIQDNKISAGDTKSYRKP